MRKWAVATTLVVVAFFAIPVGAMATGDTAVGATAPQCPVTASTGVTVVSISSELMLASDSARASAGPVAVTLAPGTYQVTLYSWDAHSTKPTQSQSQEQWKLELWDGGATAATTTAVTSDLPESTDLKDFAVGTVTVGTAVTAVKAVHAAYPSAEPHSVAPICAVFVAQGTTSVSATAPACPVQNETGVVVVNISNELLLAWDDVNSTAGPVPANVPAGTYEVLLFSWDAHSTKAHQAQTKEQWHLELWGGSALIQRFEATPDLPENVDIAGYLIEKAVIGQDVTAVKAVHAAYPDAFEPHSVAPLCAAFFGIGISSTGGNGLTGGTGDTTTNGGTTDGTGGTTTDGGTTGGTGGTTTDGGTTGGTGGTTTDGGTSGTSTNGGTTVNTGGTTIPGSSDGSTAVLSSGPPAQSLQQLPLTGIQLETGFVALLAIILGIVLLRKSRLAQARLARRNARVWRRPVR